MTEVLIELATPDEVRVDFHAFVGGEVGVGRVQDYNHCLDIVRELVGTDGAWVDGRPAGKRVLFRIALGVDETRRGESVYRGARYQRIEPCPLNVAQAGMEVYGELKRLLRRAKREWVEREAERAKAKAETEAKGETE